MTGDDEQLLLSRQRRFLVGTSIAVIAFYALDVSVKTEASHSGILLQLGRPDRVAKGLVMIWLWSLWRYGQWLYFAWNVVKNNVLEQIQLEDNRLAMKSARRHAVKLAKTGEIDGEHPIGRIVGDIRTDFGIEAILASDGEERMDGTVDDPDVVITVDGGRIYRRLQCTYYKEDGNRESLQSHNFELKFSKWRAKCHRFRSWIRALLRLPAINQHIAPLLLAAWAAAIAPFVF